MTEATRSADWAAQLKAFTNRNAGRRTILEIDAPDIGAQEQEIDYPFRGAAYDPRDQRVQIMLGEQGSVDQHLTHSIEGPREIAIQRDDRGRDRALRVVHGDGQTLLRFLET